nr:RNA-binding protein squid-like [Leptinotarsa decemlineata]
MSKMENHIGDHSGKSYHISDSSDKVTENQGDFSEIIGRDSTREGTKAEPKGDTMVVKALTSNLTDNDILTCFDQFGKMLELTMPYDTIRKQTEGFFIIRYKSEEVVDNLLKITNPTINGTKIIVSRALPTGNSVEIRSTPVIRGRGSKGSYGIQNLQRNNVDFANSSRPRTY